MHYHLLPYSRRTGQYFSVDSAPIRHADYDIVRTERIALALAREQSDRVIAYNIRRASEAAGTPPGRCCYCGLEIEEG